MDIIYRNSTRTRSYVLGDVRSITCNGGESHGRSASTNMPVNIRFYNNSADTYREQSILSALNNNRGGHDNVVELIDMAYCVTDIARKKPVLVTTFCRLNIFEWMEDYHLSATPEVRMEITRQMFAGLSFMHQASVTHGHLTRESVLVHGDSGHVKIGGFDKHCSHLTHVLADQREDLRTLTLDVAMGIWQGFPENITFENPRCRHELLFDGMPVEVFEHALEVILERPHKIMNDDFAGLPQQVTWDSLDVDFPGTHNAIRDIIAWQLSNPVSGPITSFPVPDDFHQPFAYGLLLGPRPMLTADMVSLNIFYGFTTIECKQAQLTIRQISNT